MAGTKLGRKRHQVAIEETALSDLHSLCQVHLIQLMNSWMYFLIEIEVNFAKAI
jgi:hypothetical protein